MHTRLIELHENLQISVTEDTQFVVLVDPAFQTRGSTAPASLTFELLFDTEGVKSEIIFLYKLSDSQSIQVVTVANHMVPNTSCETIVRGVLGEKARSNYTGKIIISKKAQKTSSFLSDNVLVTGEHTHNISEPLLQIEADDVSASHGAVTGRVDDEQVYYLMSRGFSRSDAQSLIIEGFFATVLNRLNDAKIREKVYARLTGVI